MWRVQLFRLPQPAPSPPLGGEGWDEGGALRVDVSRNVSRASASPDQSQRFGASRYFAPAARPLTPTLSPKGAKGEGSALRQVEGQQSTKTLYVGAMPFAASTSPAR